MGVVQASRAGWRTRVAHTLERRWQGRGALSTALLPLAWLFEAGSAARRYAYGRGLRETSRLPVPVVVVGNVVIGGAGKTPTVIAIVELLQRHGYTPGVVSRGYGRREATTRLVDGDADASAVGDEPLLVRKRTGVPVAVGADRVAAGHALLLAEPTVDLLVGDDGLQHLALERDVEVVVVDERGFGNGRLLPAGPLRERWSSRRGAPRLVLYNAATPTTAVAGHPGSRTLGGVAPLADWWAGAPPSREALHALRERDVVAVAGTARPDRFFAMLRDEGLRIVEVAPGDHHDFRRLPWPPDAADVIVTEKDAVKLPRSRPIGTRVWVARLDFALDPSFADALLALLPPPRSIADPPSTAAPDSSTEPTPDGNAPS